MIDDETKPEVRCFACGAAEDYDNTLSASGLRCARGCLPELKPARVERCSCPQSDILTHALLRIAAAKDSTAARLRAIALEALNAIEAP